MLNTRKKIFWKKKCITLNQHRVELQQIPYRQRLLNIDTYVMNKQFITDGMRKVELKNPWFFFRKRKR